jgi:hypothetical protein
LFVVASSTQCLLFTDPANEAPRVEMMLTPGSEIVMNETATFSADATDPNEAAADLRLEWFERDSGTCPMGLADARAALESPKHQGREHSKPVTKMAPFCVWVIVTDKQGARGFAGQRFDVTNRSPTAKLTLITSSVGTTSGQTMVPLYSEVRVSGAGSWDREDKEQLTYQWNVRQPADRPAPRSCDDPGAGPATKVRCFVLEHTGEYEFGLQVRDTLMAESEPATLKLMVQPDTAPCIERTEPPFGLSSFVADPNLPLVFRLLEIRDDGDSFPTAAGGPPSGELVWSFRVVGSNEGAQRFTSTTMTTLVFPRNSFRTGDVVEVWLDYRDRDPEHDPATRCKDMLTCEMPTGCFQRVSWKVSLL